MQSKDEGAHLYQQCEERLAAIISRSPALLINSERLASTIADAEKGEKQPSAIEHALHKTVPQYSGAISKAISFSAAIHKITQFYRNLSRSEQISLSIASYGGLAMSGVNFMLIPTAYIAGYIVGKPPKVTITRSAQFAYSAVLFGLALAGFLIPGVAPILGVVGASLGVSAAVIAVGKLLRDRRIWKDQLVAINTNIEDKETAIYQLEDEARNYLQQLRDLPLSDLPPEDKAAAFVALNQAVVSLYERAQHDFSDLEALKLKREVLLTKQHDVGPLKVLDRSVGVFVASVAIVGAIISLVFPPVGAFILGAAAVTGFGYFVGRVSYPVVKKVFNWLKQKIMPGEAMDASPEKPNVAFDSTLKIAQKLREPSNTPNAHHSLSESRSLKSAPQQADTAKKKLSHESEPELKVESEPATPSDTPVDQEQSNSDVKPRGQN